MCSPTSTNGLPNLIVGFVMIAAILGTAVHGQDHVSEFTRDGTPRGLASSLLQTGDLVAVGHFAKPVDLGSDPVSLLRSRELDVHFVIEDVYKGSARPGNVVTIRARIDMFVYPGEDISRYEKRIQLFQDSTEEVARVALQAEAIDQAASREAISQAQRNEEIRNLDVRNRQLYSQNTELFEVQRQIVVTHATTFYERGGVISPDAPYLISVHSIDGSDAYFALNELGMDILWGEQAEETRSALEQFRLENRSREP